MTTMVAPPPLADVNALVELAKLVSDKKEFTTRLHALQETSSKIYDDLRATAVKADEVAAKEAALSEKEVSLGQREAVIAQREAALKEAEETLAQKITALRSLVG